MGLLVRVVSRLLRLIALRLLAALPVLLVISLVAFGMTLLVPGDAASEMLGMSATPPGVQYLTFGAGTVIVSDLDVTTALVHTTTFGILGYTPEYADGLYKNAILWTLTRFQPPAGKG